MRQHDHRSNETSLLRASAWAGAAFAAIAVIGLLALPSLRLIWLVILVLGVAAVPQSFAAARREQGTKAKR